MAMFIMLLALHLNGRLIIPYFNLLICCTGNPSVIYSIKPLRGRQRLFGRPNFSTGTECITCITLPGKKVTESPALEWLHHRIRQKALPITGFYWSLEKKLLTLL